MQICIKILIVLVLLTSSAHAGTLERTATPGNRALACMITDYANQRMILCGGSNNGIPDGEWFNDVWMFDPTDAKWEELQIAGQTPAPRYNFAAAYDTLEQRMFIFGGEGTGYTMLGDLWALDLTAGSEFWTQPTTSGTPPSPRKAISAIIDPVNSRLIIFGGTNGYSGFNETWSLDLGTMTWTLLSPSGTTPEARWAHAGIYDPVGHRMIVFGGQVGSVHVNEVWSLDLTAGSEEWEQLYPGGDTPRERKHFFYTYDTLHHELVVGFGYDFPGYYVLLDDIFALNLGSMIWREVTYGPTIPGRRNPCAAYDPVNDMILIHGGDHIGALYSGDSYYLSTQPSAVEEHSADNNQVPTIQIISNPSRLPCRIKLIVSHSSALRVCIYDALGRYITTLAEEQRARGTYIFEWFGEDSEGTKVPAGSYFVRCELDGESMSQKAVLID